MSLGQLLAKHWNLLGVRWSEYESWTEPDRCPRCGSIFGVHECHADKPGSEK